MAELTPPRRRWFQFSLASNIQQQCVAATFIIVLSLPSSGTAQPTENRSPVALDFIVKRVDYPPVTDVTSPDGSVIVRFNKVFPQTVQLCKVAEPGEPEPIGPVIEVRGGWITSLAVSSDNKMIAVGTGQGDGGGRLEIWDGVAGKKLYRWDRSAWMQELSFSKDGKRLRVVHAPFPKS